MPTTRASRIGFFLMAGWLLAAGSPAGAETITYAKFYRGTTAYGTAGNPFSGSGTVYDNTKMAGTACPDVGSCTSDNIADPLAFSGLGITGTADGPATNKVWDDLAPNFGGLGVGTGTPSDADQIAGNDVLTLTFSDTVRLTGVGTLFDGGHTPFGSFLTPTAVANAIGISFLLSVDGGIFNPVAFGLANSMSLDLLGKVFAFKQEANSPEFYVSALSYGRCGPLGTSCAPPPPEVPVPGALPLFATGLAGLAWLGRRRTRRNAAALAA